MNGATRRARRPLAGAALAALLVALATAASTARSFAAGPEVATRSWRIARGEVRVLCPLTVGGSFEARTSSMVAALAVTVARPPALAGEVAVDLTTLDTGIGMRNEHMRGNYLEVGRGAGFQSAVLSDIRFADGDAATLSGRTHFSGTLLVHGTKRTVVGEADVRRDGPSVRVEAAFPVRLADYAIATPRYLGVGVKDEVEVKVSLIAVPALAADGPR